MDESVNESLVSDLREYRRRLVGEFEGKVKQDGELHMQMADLKRRIESATSLITLEAGGNGDDEREASTAPTPLRPVGAGGADAISDSAHKVLAEANRPMHYREITNALHKRGVVIGGRDPNNNVIASMTRDPRFYRPRRGTYFLRELAKGPIHHVGVRHKRGA